MANTGILLLLLRRKNTCWWSSKPAAANISGAAFDLARPHLHRVVRVPLCLGTGLAVTLGRSKIVHKCFSWNQLDW